MGLLWTGLGAWCFAFPQRSMIALGMMITDARGPVEVRAMYGGGLLAVGLGLGSLVFLGEPWVLYGLWAFFVFTLGLALGRLAGIVLEGGKPRVMWGWFASELVLLALIASALMVA
jgi:hypothetical protein